MPCFRWLLRLFGSSQLNRICIYNTAYTKPRVLRNTSPLGDDLEFDLSYLFGLSYERAFKSPMHRSRCVGALLGKAPPDGDSPWSLHVGHLTAVGRHVSVAG